MLRGLQGVRTKMLDLSEAAGKPRGSLRVSSGIDNWSGMQPQRDGNWRWHEWQRGTQSVCATSAHWGWRQRFGDGLGDFLAVKAAVFDEDLVGMHSGNDHPRQEDTGSIAFERIRIRARALTHRVQSDAERRQELEIGM